MQRLLVAYSLDVQPELGRAFRWCLDVFLSVFLVQLILQVSNCDLGQVIVYVVALLHCF